MFSRQTFEVWQPLKQTIAPKVSCLYVFDQRVSVIFHCSQLSGIFLAQKQHTWLQKLFLRSRNSWKEYFIERKQIKSTTVTYSKLRMFGGKSCHVCTQWEHVFSSGVHAKMQPTVKRVVPYCAAYSSNGRINHLKTLMLNLGCLCCYIPKWILRQGCKILIGFDVIQDDFRVCLPGEKNRRKINSSHQQGSWARDYDNLLFCRINGPTNVYAYGSIACEQGDIVRVHARASPLARASSRGSHRLSLALVVTNPWIAEHHIVWCSIT